MKHSLFLLVSGLLLTGCLSVETAIDLNRNGSGRLDIVYEIDEELYGLGVFDDTDNALPVPISRNQFEETVGNIPGLRLRRYRVSEEIGMVTVTARLLFDSVAALNAWYGGGPTAISVTQEGESTAWRQLLYPGGGSSGEVGTALAASLDGYRISYRLSPPSTVISAGIGEITNNGRTASVEVGLREIVTAESPLYWVVTW
ncbi:MAG: hypothetical protein V3S41_01755 [Spirochaetia bacterium]